MYNCFDDEKIIPSGIVYIFRSGKWEIQTGEITLDKNIAGKEFAQFGLGGPSWRREIGIRDDDDNIVLVWKRGAELRVERNGRETFGSISPLTDTRVTKLGINQEPGRVEATKFPFGQLEMQHTPSGSPERR